MRHDGGAVRISRRAIRAFGSGLELDGLVHESENFMVGSILFRQRIYMFTYCL